MYLHDTFYLYLADSAKLYVGSQYNITRMNLNGTSFEHVASGKIADLDMSVNALFWIDSAKNKVSTVIELNRLNAFSASIF